MVLSGKVQKDLVGLLNEHGPHAVGLSGEDGRTLTAVKRYAQVGGERVDIGLVGDVARVNTAVVRLLLEGGHIPVVSSVGRGEDGQVYNVNADTAAGALAAALGTRVLVVLTDVPGLYADFPRDERVVDRIGAAELERVLPGLDGGMGPKMEACLRAVRGGVGVARVLDGRAPHALLDGLVGGAGSGTTIVPDPTDPTDPTARGAEVEGVARVAPAPAPVPVAKSNTRKILTYVAFGVGGAGLVAGSVTGALALGKRSDLRGQCLSDGSCPSSQRQRIDNYHAFGTVSGIAFGVGIAGIATGVVLLVTQPKGEEPTPQAGLRVRPVLGLGVLGAEGTF
jgi:acetylglutamate kinase